MEADGVSTNDVVERVQRVRESTDLGVSKRVEGSGELLMGGGVEFAVGVTNYGQRVAHGVVVKEAWPAGLELEGWSGGVGEVRTNGTGELEWVVGDLGVGSGAEVRLMGRGIGVGVWTNVVVGSMEEVDESSGNDRSEAEVRVAAMARVGLAVQGMGRVLLGGEGVEELVVTNAGPSEASAVVVGLAGAEGLALAGWESSAGELVTNGSGGLEWSVGTVGVGGEQWLRLSWRGVGVGVWTNVYGVSAAEGDAEPADNVASV